MNLAEFVAMPLGHGYTVESQVTGREVSVKTHRSGWLPIYCSTPYTQDIGGMHFDVFKEYLTTVTFRCKDRNMSLLRNPAQEGLKLGDYLSMHDKAR